MRTKRQWRRAAVLLVIAVPVLIAALVFLTPRGGPIPSGLPSGEVAFLSNRGGMWDLWLIDSSGVLRNLTSDDFPDYFASWDFASERVNFLTGRTGELGPAQVFPDGSNLRTLSIVEAISTLFFEGRTDWDPAWSPDGARVLWASLRDFNLELYVSDNLPDAPAQRLTADGGRDWFGAWSPDGTRIAFASDRSGNEDIYVMNADGSGLRMLTDHPADDVYPVWSLDGETLLFVSERDALLSSGDLRLYMLDPDVEAPVAGPLAENARFAGDPTYAADGREVVYMSNEGGRWSLYVMSADGSDVRRITDGAGDDLFPVWRPLPKN
jgi:TolB protein